MSFKRVNIEDEIKMKKQQSQEYNNIWNESEDEYRLIGEMIELRKQEKKTQAELAEILGKKQQVISRLEKHESKPSLRIFCNILDALGYTLKIEKKI